MSAATKSTQRLAYIDIDKILVADNVRIDLRNIDDLAGSIRKRGVLEPLTVVASEDGEHVELLIGHRRLAAAELARLTKVPCVVRTRAADDAERVLDQLTENLHRDDLTALEKAQAVKRLRDDGMTIDQIAAHVNRSDQWVKNLLHLLTLPECVQDAVHKGWTTYTRALDIPQPMLDRPGAQKRLETYMANQRANGLQYWYQHEYHLINEERLASEARAATPSKRMTDTQAAAEGRRQWEAERQAQQQDRLKREAFNAAAHRIIELHRAEFDALYETILDGLMVI